METSLASLKNTLQSARQEMAKVIIGQEAVIDYCLIAIFTGQHALVEGVPGVAKTLLVKTLAQVLGCDSSRVQFTPDLMPSDLTGTNIFNFQTNQFTLVPGPIFGSFLLADEINRAPAKTQSALLQAMAERVVTIDRDTYNLPANFTVFATQNPQEFEGTYPLPEAQKDRFMFKIGMSFPDREEELTLARRMLGADSPEAALRSGAVQAVITSEELQKLRSVLKEITIREELVSYIVDLVRATRTHSSILSGAGPRATQALLLASRAFAALQDRDFVIPEDVRSLCSPVLAHRLILRPEYEIEGLTPDQTINKIIESIPVPR